MDAPSQHVQNQELNALTLAANVGRKQSTKAKNQWLEPRRVPPMGIADAKERVDFVQLVEKTHTISRTGKVVCPAHDDRTPSCHIYPDHWFCFSCGAGGDVIDWLEQVDNLSTADAVAKLRDLAGDTAPATPSTSRITAKPQPKKAVLAPIAGDVLTAHLERAERLARGPLALSGRGFTLSDLRQLGIAADGDDAIIPITGPNGDVLALKRRFAVPRGKSGKMRYVYDTPNHGTPAWCSLNLADRPEALVIEGELNGMACWLARPELGVMGVAGTSGDLYPDALKDKIVYVYADGDQVGLAARTRWAKDAQKAGAAKVYVLEPWEMDACDVAGKLGRAELAGRLS